MDWESRSWAAWWEEDGAAAIEAREHAYREFKAAGDARGAARMALWLGLDHIEFRGEQAVAQGWLALRAHPRRARAWARARLVRRLRGGVRHRRRRLRRRPPARRRGA